MNTKKQIFLSLFLILIPLMGNTNSSLQLNNEPLVIKTGEPRYIITQPNDKIHVDSNAYFNISDMGNRIKLVGKRKGKTNLSINGRSQEVIVLPPLLFKDYNLAFPAIKSSYGLTLTYNQGKLQIQGQLYSSPDFFILNDFLKKCSQSILWRAQVEESILAEFTSQLLKTNSPKEIRDIQTTNSPYFHFVFPKGKTHLADKLSRSLYPIEFKNEIQQNTIEKKDLIEVKVVIAEVNKKWIEQFGFDWQKSYTQKILPQSQGDSLIVELSMSKNQNSGQILASPKLVTESGHAAEFLAGGEFAIRTRGENYSSVQWRPHGLLLKITPKSDLNNRIQLKIESEFSVVDHSQSVEDIPALKTNKTKTQVNLNSGESIAISGLIQENIGSGSNGLLGLQEIPFLGELFKSRNYQKDISELVVVVTPQIVESPSNNK